MTSFVDKLCDKIQNLALASCAWLHWKILMESKAESLSKSVDLIDRKIKMNTRIEKMIDAEGLSRLKSFRQFGISCPTGLKSVPTLKNL